MAKSQVFKSIGRIFLLAFALFILLSTLATLPLRWINPGLTAFTVRDDIDYSLRERWVGYSELSPELLLAVIAAEDQKFPQHFGLDVESIKKSLAETRGRRRGASTITQQLAKNLYLSPSRSLFRKGLEAWLSVCIEFFLPKTRILELYVNVIEFGPGVYGVNKASGDFFLVSATGLDRWQASFLAAVLPNPKQMSVTTPSHYVSSRAASIRRSMSALGGIAYLQAL
ncbi:MAG: monofunctional biosynthetic peptidoglycan transglycosylase [Pseudomonadota bacterium]